MKKLIALVLTLAMLVTCFAFSASAETAPSIVIAGPDSANVGDTIVVDVNVNDADKVVGGIQGTITVTGAEISKIEVQPALAYFNEATNNAGAIYNEENGVIKFAAVNDLSAASSATSTWFKLTLVVEEEATVALSNVKASTKAAKSLAITTGEAYTLTAETPVSLNFNLDKVGVREQSVANDQGIVVKASINVPDEVNLDEVNITEFGVLFCPTTLLAGEELTYENAKAIKATITKADEEDKFNSLLEKGTFSAILNFNFDNDVDAAKFLGTKVSSRVYYVIDGVAYYSTNSVDSYIQNGVANKAAFQTLLIFANSIEEANNACTEVSYAEYQDIKGKVSTTAYPDDWYANRCKVLKYAVSNAAALRRAQEAQ